MKTALVLSGGGSKGAFQVGALTQLAERGVEFDLIAGVSVGSLNGAMVAQNKLDQMRYVWEQIDDDSIYTKYSYVRILWRNLWGKKSLYDATPLFNLIKENVKLTDFVKEFKFGITSLTDGSYYSLRPTDFDDELNLQKGIYASSLMPILWEPVDLTIKGKTLYQCVDGGLRNVTPLNDVLASLPDMIYIINCNTPELEVKHPRNIVQVASRTFMDIMLSEVVDTDVKELLKINNLVLQAKNNGYEITNPSNGQVYKYFDVYEINPPHKLGNPIVFNPNLIQENFKLGYELAKIK